MSSKENKRCGNCEFYQPEEGEIGSGNCDEIREQEEEGEGEKYSIAVIATECECGGKYWRKGKMNVVPCPCRGQGSVDINETVFLGGKPGSWENFFDVMNNRKGTIERIDGKSIGNFWAFVQMLQDRFLETRNEKK